MTMESRSPSRGLSLSDKMPNHGDSTRAGASISAPTMPTQVAECVSSQALQPSKNRSSQAPKLENQLTG